MKKIAVVLPTALLLMLASTAYGQSLSDLANKEKERREEIKNARVITDEDAAKYRSATVPDQPSGENETEKKGSEAKIQSRSEKPDPDEPVDLQGRTESFWRKTMADARQKVKDLENETNVLILKLNDLQMKFYREDNGFKREGIQREIQKTFYEQDLNRENLAKAKNTLQDLENEARKSGALPGWIEARNP